MRIKKFVTFIALLTILTITASAKYITLGHTVTVEQIIQGNETTINVTLLNSGDEAAYDTQLSLLLPEGIGSKPIFLGKMDPNMPQSGTFDIGIDSGVMPGKYSLVILTEYKDANGYPFSSVSPNSLILKEVTSSQVFGKISELTLGDKGERRKLTLELRNMDDKDHDLQIRLFGPRELKIDLEERSLVLNARGVKKIDFAISSFGALPESSYVVFASMDYEEGGIHYSATARGVVKIVEQKEAISFSGELPLVALIILILIVVIYQFRK